MKKIENNKQIICKEFILILFVLILSFLFFYFLPSGCPETRNMDLILKYNPYAIALLFVLISLLCIFLGRIILLLVVGFNVLLKSFDLMGHPDFWTGIFVISIPLFIPFLISERIRVSIIHKFRYLKYRTFLISFLLVASMTSSYYSVQIECISPTFEGIMPIWSLYSESDGLTIRLLNTLETNVNIRRIDATIRNPRSSGVCIVKNPLPMTLITHKWADIYLVCNTGKETLSGALKTRLSIEYSYFSNNKTLNSNGTFIVYG
jgi:hypothetical protein